MEKELKLTEYQLAIIEELKHILIIENYKERNEKIELDLVALMDKY